MKPIQLPSGVIPVAVSLAVNGVATYAFLALANSSLAPERYDELAVVWAAAYTIGPGLFQPVEQELSRAVSERRARGLPIGDVLFKSAAVAVGLAVCLAGGLALGWSMDLLGFLGRGRAVLALVIALLGFAGSEVVRGLLAGSGSFRGFAVYIAAEGVIRLVLLVVLGLLGLAESSLVLFAFATGFAASSMIAMAGHRFERRTHSSAPWRPYLGRVAVLAVAAVGEAVVLNIGPVAVSVLGAGLSGAYLNALVIARVPVFFFQAVKVALLPHLAAAATKGDLASVKRSLRSVGLLIAGLGAVGVLLAAVVGPSAVELIFRDRPRAIDMTLLASATAGLMFVITLSVTLISLGRAGTTAGAWGGGLAVFAALLAIDGDPRTRVGLALVGMVTVAALSQAAIVARCLRGTGS